MAGMRSAWRIIVGTVCGVTAAVMWAVSLAVYQQLMEPTGFFVDKENGSTYPNLASNNTYWPREIRHLAILLALAGVAVICRARPRGLAAGAVGAIAWLSADLWLDRIDIDGRTAAIWLAAVGIATFAATAGVASWLTQGRPDSTRVRYVAAGTVTVLAALTLLISTPWDEPVIEPDQVRIENALSVMQVGLVVLFLVATVALVVDGLTRAHAWWFAGFLAIAAAIAGVTLATNGQSNSFSSMAMIVVGLLAVAAARDVPRTVLPAVAAAGLVMLPVVIVVVLIGGMIAGGTMTSIAGNPAVNGADTDLTFGLPGLVVGVLTALVTSIVASAPRAAEKGRAVPAIADS
jgi:hypothetical protein